MLLIKVVTYASAMKINHYSMVDPSYSFGMPRVLPNYNDYLNLKDDVFNLNFKNLLIIAHFKRITLIIVKINDSHYIQIEIKNNCYVNQC